MSPSNSRAEEFRSLHAGPRPLLLVNVWDETSARIAVAAGAVALGTTSFGVAADHGVRDGEVLPLTEALDLAGRIAAAVDVPLTLDLESGGGATPAAVGEAVAAAIDRGVVGVNIEDRDPTSPDGLRPEADQAERLAAARDAASAAGVALFVNARCDVYFGASTPAEERVDQVQQRARRYREAGADGVFVPGLLDLAALEQLAAAVPLPVNVMAAPGMPPVDDLAAAGVRRISQGGNLFLEMAGAVSRHAARYLAGTVSPSMEDFGGGLGLLPSLLG